MGTRRRACAARGGGRPGGLREPGGASPATTRPSPPPSAPGWHRPRAASCTRAGRTCTRSSAISSSPTPGSETALGLARESQSPLDEARLLGALAALWGGYKDYERGLALSREAVAAAESAGETPEGRRVAAEAGLRAGLMEAEPRPDQREPSGASTNKPSRRFRAAGDGGGEGRALDALAMVTALGGDLDGGDGSTLARRCRAWLAPMTVRPRPPACPRWPSPSSGAAGGPRGSHGSSGGARRHPRDRGAHAGGVRALHHRRSSWSRFGDWGLALEEASAGLALARALGHREWTVAGLATVGRLRRNCGDVTGAQRLHEEMLAIARDAPHHALDRRGAGRGGTGPGSRGGPATACAGSAKPSSWPARRWKFAGRPLVALADLAAPSGTGRRGARGGAPRPARWVPQFAEFATDARRVEGEALRALGQAAEAETLLRQAKTEAAALGLAPGGWRASLALARLLDSTGRADEARVARADARRLLEKVAVGLAGYPDLLRGFEASPAYREAGVR